MRQRGTRDRVKRTLRKGRPRFVVFIMCDDVACGWGTPGSACGGIAGSGIREKEKGDEGKGGGWGGGREEEVEGSDWWEFYSAVRCQSLPFPTRAVRLVQPLFGPFSSLFCKPAAGDSNLLAAHAASTPALYGSLVAMPSSSTSICGGATSTLNSSWLPYLLSENTTSQRRSIFMQYPTSDIRYTRFVAPITPVYPRSRCLHSPTYRHSASSVEIRQLALGSVYQHDGVLT